MKPNAMKFIVKKYCLVISNNENQLCNWQKNTADKNWSVRKNKQHRLIILWNCVFCGKKKSTFIKNKQLHNLNNISND